MHCFMRYGSERLTAKCSELEFTKSFEGILLFQACFCIQRSTTNIITVLNNKNNKYCFTKFSLSHLQNKLFPKSVADLVSELYFRIFYNPLNKILRKFAYLPRLLRIEKPIPLWVTALPYTSEGFLQKKTFFGFVWIRNEEHIKCRYVPKRMDFRNGAFFNSEWSLSWREAVYRFSNKVLRMLKPRPKWISDLTWIYMQWSYK